MRMRITDLRLPPNTCAAAGSDQAGATLLPSAGASVSAADGTKGVRLIEPSAGRVALVYNEHATAGLKVYPHTGGDINDGSTNAAVTIEGKTLALFWALDATTWAAIYTVNS